MAGGLIKLWNEWATQILVLLSFALQIFLFLFARTRRRGPSAVLKILLWLAYLMVDSTAVYTLGHLSISGSLHEHELVVFWAPFLLVHLGSQDTITAYALEDNKLWPRHLLNLCVQAFGVAYVLYKHIAEIPTLLGLATSLMFGVGLSKYGERIWALKCATLDSIRSSIRKPHALPTYSDELHPRVPRRAKERDEEELLLFSHDMLPLCKGAMADSPVALFRFQIATGAISSKFYIPSWKWKTTLRVVEMELSLMYDVIYTKAAVIHTWYGYLFRLVSPLATVGASILFQLSGNKNGYSRVDVAITYILLVGAFLLDMASVFSTLGSTWTCNFLWRRGWTKLGNVIMSLRRLVKAAAGNRGWSGSIGQFNLLHFCSRDTTKLISRVTKMIGLEDCWNKIHYSETLVISEDVKELVFQSVWQVVKEIHDPGVKDEIQSPRYAGGHMMPCGEIYNLSFHPESFEDTNRRRMQLSEALGFGAELQEIILTWHVFTDVFLLCSGTPKNKDAAYGKAIKALSNYMVFLIAIRPDTIPGLELRSLYEATRDSLDEVWNTCAYVFEPRFTPPPEKKREGKLAHVLQGDLGCRIDGKPSIILRRGVKYANLLLELVDTRNPDKSGIISRHEGIDRAGMEKLKGRLMPDLESSCRGGVLDMTKALALILDAWVRLLIFASVRYNRDAHARQMNCGGELTTVVWLMEQHAAMFFKPSAEEEHIRSPEDSENEEIELGGGPHMV
ncbi:hypothetical protein VPH35_094277 [Triticum aestivum]